MNRRIAIGLVLLLLLLAVWLFSVEDAAPPPSTRAGVDDVAPAPDPEASHSPPGVDPGGNAAADPKASSGEKSESKEKAAVPGFFPKITGARRRSPSLPPETDSLPALPNRSRCATMPRPCSDAARCFFSSSCS